VTFAGINPLRGKDGVALLERSVREFGCGGMGEWVGQQWNVRADDRELCYPYFEKCIELDIPFLTNSTSGHPVMDPAIFDRIATDLPELRIVLWRWLPTSARL